MLVLQSHYLTVLDHSAVQYMVGQNDINSTSQNSMQFSKYGATFRNISHNSGMIYIFGNMYNGFRSVIGVVPGCTLLVGKVCGKGENILGRGYLTESFGRH